MVLKSINSSPGFLTLMFRRTLEKVFMRKGREQEMNLNIWGTEIARMGWVHTELTN